MRNLARIGERHGQLTVIGINPNKHGEKNTQVLCQCDCGAQTTTGINNIRRGLTTSCGCVRAELSAARRRIHGLSGSRAHSIWKNMRRRCELATVPCFPRYGGRGITVCDDWKTFEAFYRDMGDPPSPAHSIERIDNNAGYNPDNCRWATVKEQARNTRRNRFVVIDGQTMCLSDAMRLTGIRDKRYWHRLSLSEHPHHGLPINKSSPSPNGQN